MKIWKTVEETKENKLVEAEEKQPQKGENCQRKEVSRGRTSRAKGKCICQETVNEHLWSTNGFETRRIWEDPVEYPMDGR